jgi:hypothetical protein
MSDTITATSAALDADTATTHHGSGGDDGENRDLNLPQA